MNRAQRDVGAWPTEVTLAVRDKMFLALRIWSSWAVIAWKLRREPLPLLVSSLAQPRGRARVVLPPTRLGRNVHRVLHPGKWGPRCLTQSLVLYRLLQQQGAAAEIVIGLPQQASTKDAHAWVEVQGVDVGPPPGGSGHVELVRYGARAR